MHKPSTKVQEISQIDYEKCIARAPVCIAMVDLDGRFISINEAWTDFLGYSQEEFMALEFQEITHPHDLENDLARLNELITGHIDSYVLEKRYQHKRGYFVWARLSVSLVCDDKGLPLHFVGVVENISAQKQSETKLFQSEEKFRTIVNSLSEEMVIWMASPGIEDMLFVSKGYSRIWGAPVESLYRNPKSFIEYIHDEDKAAVLREIESHKTGKWDIEYRIVNDAGETYYMHDVGHPIHDEFGELQCVVCTAFDRSRDKRKEQELAKAYTRLIQTNERLNELAITDYLTGVKNRRAIESLLNDEIKLFQRNEVNAVLMMFDLDNFKYVNDEYGHGAGDKVLIKFAHTLFDNMRETDEVGRLGGDEFVLLLRNSDEREAKRFLDRLISADLHIDVGVDRPIPINFSAGVVQLEERFYTARDWLIEADVRMYADKTD